MYNAAKMGTGLYDGHYIIFSIAVIISEQIGVYITLMKTDPIPCRKLISLTPWLLYFSSIYDINMNGKQLQTLNHYMMLFIKSNTRLFQAESQIHLSKMTKLPIDN